MALEAFQTQTVRAAVAALTDQRGSRRFLIADEVGLGKTVSAKAIAAELKVNPRRPFNVVYLCPNLGIASQNLKKLRALDPDWQRPEDRLSLVLGGEPPTSKGLFRIYCYTPETSLPGWKAGQRSGRFAERALLASLLKTIIPTFWRKVAALNDQRIEDGQGAWFPPHPDAPPVHLLRPFEAALRAVMALTSKPLDDGLGLWLDKRDEDVAELILRGRAALALTALHHSACRPDLLILDEFHRYADLFIASPPVLKTELDRERYRVHRLLADTLIGQNGEGPALLLLSATPYRLQRLDQGEMPGGRYAHFVQLVHFLYGDGASAQASQLDAAIAAHHAALARRDNVAAALQAVETAKHRLEKLLRPVIARTERATSIAGELFDRRDRPAHIQPRDLVTFRHLARAVDKNCPTMRSWVQPLWSSAPYPAETLFSYKLCAALGRDLPPVRIDADKGEPAHPQLRSLVDPRGDPAETLSPDALSLPWLAPTRPWWALGGRWRELQDTGRLRGKALLFSRYLGTPAAVSAWLSHEVDRTSSHQQRGKGKFAAQAYLRLDKKAPLPLIALFMPWPKLCEAFELSPRADLNLTKVKHDARRDFRKWLGGRIAKTKRPARKPWQTAFDLEDQLGGSTLINRALRQQLRAVKSNPWRRPGAPMDVTHEEADALADWLLGAPGAVVARTMRRHAPTSLFDPDAFTATFEFGWRHLRQHFGQRYFAGAILGRRRRRHGGYPEALRRAILEGGFEATLDEHVAVMRLIGDDLPLKILEQSLVGRPGLVRRRSTGRGKRFRVHAAAPYLGADRKGPRNDRGGKIGKSEKLEKLRSDALRNGFNSPFWPHVLATTSVGQEGLDFHVWCDRVVHWDLPRDPVDFEQREGRIARYASLGVRRALADTYGGGPLAPWQSPFGAIFDAARDAPREGLGLERWWSPPSYRPVSITFNLPFSLSGQRLAYLREDLVRYRLALGQPEPQLFQSMIEHFSLSTDEARELALNLSPAVLTRPTFQKSEQSH